MTTLADWHVVGPIAANDSTVDLWRQSSRHIWRIRTDGAPDPVYGDEEF